MAGTPSGGSYLTTPKATPYLTPAPAPTSQGATPPGYGTVPGAIPNPVNYPTGSTPIVTPPASLPTYDNPTPAAPAASAPVTDWLSYYFASWGLPDDVINQLRGIFTQYGSDTSGAVAASTVFIRGTDWYAKTYPGIAAGIKSGLFSDEGGYRSYVTSIDQYAQQYLGRNVTTDEILGYITSGFTPESIGNQLQQANLLPYNIVQKYPGIQAGVRGGLFSDEGGYNSYVTSIKQYYQQYLGRDATDAEIQSAITTGLTPDVVGKQLAAGNWVTTNTGDVQLLSGAFGAGQLDQGQLNALGRSEVGLNNSVGDMLQNALQKAQQRFTTMFGGTTGQAGMSLVNGKLTATSMQKPGGLDIQA